MPARSGGPRAIPRTVRRDDVVVGIYRVSSAACPPTNSCAVSESSAHALAHLNRLIKPVTPTTVNGCTAKIGDAMAAMAEARMV